MGLLKGLIGAPQDRSLRDEWKAGKAVAKEHRRAIAQEKADKKAAKASGKK